MVWVEGGAAWENVTGIIKGDDNGSQLRRPSQIPPWGHRERTSATSSSRLGMYCPRTCSPKRRWTGWTVIWGQQNEGRLSALQECPLCGPLRFHGRWRSRNEVLAHRYRFSNANPYNAVRDTVASRVSAHAVSHWLALRALVIMNAAWSG